MKKLITLLLALVMLLSMFAGCTQTGNNQSKPDAPGSSAEASGAEDASKPDDGPMAAPSGIPTIIKETPDNMEWMYDTTPIEFTLYYNEPTNDPWSWEDAEVRRYITERTGVSLKYEFAPDNEGTRLNLMLAGGEKLPDYIARVWGTAASMKEMIEGEYIMCMEDLINEHCPLMWKVLGDATPYLTRWDDGKMWYLPWLCTPSYTDYGSLNGYIMARTDILEELGENYKSVRTTGQLKDVLARFMENRDNYPEVVYPLYLSIAPALSGLFGGGDFGTVWYDKANGNCLYWFESDAGRDTLMFFNELYRDGYINPECFVTSDDYISTLGAGKVFYAMNDNVWQYSSANGALAENVEGARLSNVYPITSDGNMTWRKTIGFNGGSNLPVISITADCSNPGRAVKFLEYLATEEGQLTVNNGVYGKDWELKTDDAGRPYPMPVGEALEASLTGFEALGKLGIYDYAHFWLVLDGNYDVLTTYWQSLDPDALPEEIRESRSYWFDNCPEYDARGLSSMVTVPKGSDLAVLQNSLEEIWSNTLSKIVTASSADEAQTIYKSLLSRLDAAGKGDYLSQMYDKTVELENGLIDYGVIYK